MNIVYFIKNRVKTNRSYKLLPLLGPQFEVDFPPFTAFAPRGHLTLSSHLVPECPPPPWMVCVTCHYQGVDGQSRLYHIIAGGGQLYLCMYLHGLTLAVLLFCL